MEEGADKRLMEAIAKILEDVKASIATHNRKIKDLAAVRSKSPSFLHFSAAFIKTLTPLFYQKKRTAASERVVRFVSVFSSARDPTNASCCDEFLDSLLKFLLVVAAAADKTARFRACQIISEIILRLPDDSEVSDELWDEVIESMKARVVDKVPAIRTFAVRALSRFVNDTENKDILALFLELLPLESNGEVRKSILLSLPPSAATSQVIVDCTMDISEPVRKAAFYVLANKFPLHGLSIKLRTIILKRGLTDRSPVVSKECLKLTTDQWLGKCCDGDPVKLLKYLDVETYEMVGESVMEALLRSGFVLMQEGDSIQKYVISASEGDLTSDKPTIRLMEPEVALYWKTVCKHLQAEAQAKGSDAASTLGTEAVVYAAEASDKNDLLEQILPATVSDYINLVNAHINAGPNYHFASRQLLLLGEMLDYSDAAIRKLAGSFVQDLLHRPPETELDIEGNKILIGDGINLGGDKEWADAVGRLARKVHAAYGEFEEVLLGIVDELARPCRERTADFVQWMQCLAVTGLLLEKTKSLHLLQGRAIEPTELLHSLLLPGAKHVQLDVQRITVRCLGLFGLLELKPNKELVKQLRYSFYKGPGPISAVACKALFDLALWHGPSEVDKVMGQNLSSFPLGNGVYSTSADLSDDEHLNMQLLDFLYAGFETDCWGNFGENDDSESVQAVLGEGFAKVLLLSKKYPSIPSSLHHLFLFKLITLYFGDESKELLRLRQCLSVFFEHYAVLSTTHKDYLSQAFLPVMRSMWPGINGNAAGSPTVVSNMRKRTIQASKFMLQMLQAPLYAEENKLGDENKNFGSSDVDCLAQPSIECAQEGLAIRIAIEVLRFQGNKTSAGKSYMSALCRVLASLHFRSSEQGPIKLMRRLLGRVRETVLHEKELVKELQEKAEQLKGLDKSPDEPILEAEAKCIFEKLEVDFNIMDVDELAGTTQTPAQPKRSRRKVRRQVNSSTDEEEEEEEEECSSVSVRSAAPSGREAPLRRRSERASKTAALSKMTSSLRGVKIEEEDAADEVDQGEEEASDLSSEADSDE